jgi:hypothetical protein
MTRSEYEAQRRRLDEEMRVAIEMVKAGHQAKIQVLELMLTMSGEGTPEPVAVPPLPEPELRPRRRGIGDLLHEVAEIVPRLPVLFTKDDVEKELAEPTDRASLYRALRDLEEDGWHTTETLGRGRKPAVYRRLVPGDGAETA